MEDLTITASAAQWLTTAFMLTMAVVIPITGFHLQRFNTRPVFIAAMTLFSVGTLIAALVLGAARIKNVTTPRRVPIDLLSVILSAFGFGGLGYGLSNLGVAEGGSGTPAGWLPLGVGVVAIILFVLRQLSLQRTDRALLDLRTFASKTFTLSIAHSWPCSSTR